MATEEVDNIGKVECPCMGDPSVHLVNGNMEGVE